MAEDSKKVYIALDCEGAGSNPLMHPTLSVGACVVTPELLSFEERQERGLVFYTELKPESLEYEIDAMRVGCAELDCLKGREDDPTLDLRSPKFRCIAVLNHMQRVCEGRREAMNRFRHWVSSVAGGAEVVGVTDTVFYDSVRFSLELAKDGGTSPFGWKGLDLASLNCGIEANLDTRLGDLVYGPERFIVLKDRHIIKHKADHDACATADIATLLFGLTNIGW